MVVDHAFGIAGGAGRVVERDRAAFVDRRRPREIRIALRDEALVFDLAEALARSAIELVVDVDDERALLRHRQGRPNLAGKLAIGDQHFGLAVLEDVGDGGGLEPGIDGVEHGAQHGHAVMRLHHGRHVRQHDRDGIAGAHAGCRQRRRQLPRPVVKLAIAVSAGAVDHGGAVGMDVGATWQERYRGQSREIRGARLQVLEDVVSCASSALAGGQRWAAGIGASCLATTGVGRFRLARLGHLSPLSPGVIGAAARCRHDEMLQHVRDPRLVAGHHSRARWRELRGSRSSLAVGRRGGADRDILKPTWQANAAVRRSCAARRSPRPASNPLSRPAMRGGATDWAC